MGLNQGSITGWTVLAAILTEWMFRPFAWKRHCQHSQIYCSKQFQVCTRPVSFSVWLIWNPYVVACRCTTCCDTEFWWQGHWSWAGVTDHKEKVISTIPIIVVSTFVQAAVQMQSAQFHSWGRCYLGFFLGPISMDAVNAYSLSLSFLPLPHTHAFQNTLAAWLKQRSPRQVNNQPTQSAVCDRFHANKAFSYSLLRGSTRQGLSNVSLLIAINPRLFSICPTCKGERINGGGGSLGEQRYDIKMHFSLLRMVVLYLRVVCDGLEYILKK